MRRHVLIERGRRQHRLMGRRIARHPLIARTDLGERMLQESGVLPAMGGRPFLRPLLPGAPGAPLEPLPAGDVALPDAAPLPDFEDARLWPDVELPQPEAPELASPGAPPAAAPPEAPRAAPPVRPPDLPAPPPAQPPAVPPATPAEVYERAARLREEAFLTPAPQSGDEIFAPREQPRTPQEWARKLAEATSLPRPPAPDAPLAEALAHAAADAPRPPEALPAVPPAVPDAAAPERPARRGARRQPAADAPGEGGTPPVSPAAPPAELLQALSDATPAAPELPSGDAGGPEAQAPAETSRPAEAREEAQPDAIGMSPEEIARVVRQQMLEAVTQPSRPPLPGLSDAPAPADAPAAGAGPAAPSGGAPAVVQRSPDDSAAPPAHPPAPETPAQATDRREPPARPPLPRRARFEELPGFNQRPAPRAAPEAEQRARPEEPPRPAEAAPGTPPRPQQEADAPLFAPRDDPARSPESWAARLAAAVRRQSAPESAEAPAPAADATPAPPAQPPATPAEVYERTARLREEAFLAPAPQSGDEIFAPREQPRTPQEWARKLAEATSPPRPPAPPQAARPQRAARTAAQPAPPQAAAPTVQRAAIGREALPVAPEAAQLPPPQMRRGAPAPLPETTRRFLRPLVGLDPADVRVYQDAAAGEAAAELAADAVTVDEEVLLPPQAQPDSPEALGLIAHELTHVARRRAPHFVPPLLRPAPAEGPDAAQPAPRPALDEEGIAGQVEAQVRRLAREAADDSGPREPAPRQAEPPAAPPAERPRRAESSERWGDLPAPWEPLPAWLGDAQAPAESSTVALHAAADGGAPAPAVQLAETGRAVDEGQSPVAPAMAPEPPAPPAPDLDDLARQVYATLKNRLAAERRRSGW